MGFIKHFLTGLLLLSIFCNSTENNEKAVSAAVPIVVEPKAEPTALPVPPKAENTEEAPQNLSLDEATGWGDADENDPMPIPEEAFDSIFNANALFLADGFDFPVGKPDGVNYFKALNFGQRLHLGEDWNGVGGGNSDLGDPVYSIGNGLVVFSENVCCGWGNVVRVVHRIPNGRPYEYVESVYAHLSNYSVRVGTLVKRGDLIATIGTGDGRYSAHLHLEMRDFIYMSLGPGYSTDTYGYINPTPFIHKNRPDHTLSRQ